MTLAGYLYRAQAALSALEHITCFYSEEADAPPADFGFGLSVLLGYINDNVTRAYNELTKEEAAE
ncbi:MAG: hypothetical protein LBQ57_13320 [Spirochaetales bacterium]|jgi:hypothetical protein|nr:hypothetical protein [Spirochaetales bacterium]